MMVVIDRPYLKPFLKRLLFSSHPHTDSAEMENYVQIFSEWASLLEVLCCVKCALIMRAVV